MKESTFFHRYKEIILGVFMLALASFYLYNATLIKTKSTVSVSAKMIPMILGCLVLCLGVAQLGVGIKYLIAARKRDKEEGTMESFTSRTEMRNAVPVILTFLVILLYAAVFEFLGFILSSIACMFCLMWILAPKDKFKPVKFALIAIVVAIVVYIAFRRGLDLSLPAGVLEGLPFM